MKTNKDKEQSHLQDNCKKKEKNKKKKDSLFSVRYLFHDLVFLTGGIPGLIWFRPKVIYENERARKPIKGGALLISNHIGLIDPIYLMMAVWYRRHRFICLKMFFDNPFRALLFKGFLCIPIDQDNFGIDSYRTITDHLAKGRLVSMFPEGHIGKGEETKAFKTGMVMMAAKNNTPIIPAYIIPKKKLFGRLKVVLGEPVIPCEKGEKRPSMEKINELAEALYQKELYLRSIANTK